MEGDDDHRETGLLEVDVTAFRLAGAEAGSLEGFHDLSTGDSG